MSHDQSDSFHSDVKHSQDSDANHGHDAHHHGNTDSVSKRCLFIVTLIGTAYTMVFLFENWPSGDAKVIKTPTLTLSSGERLLATSARFVTLLRNLDKWYSDEINVDHHDHDNLCKCVCDHEQGHESGHEHEHDHESDHEKKPAQNIKSGSGKIESSGDMKKAPPVTQPIKVLKSDQKVVLNETNAKIAKDEKKMKEKKVTEEVKEEKKKKKEKKEEKKDGAAKAA